MKHDLSDGELVKRLKNNDDSAFDELYARYHKLVYFIAFEMCHSDADAQDILQDTFIQIKKSIQTLHDDNLFKPWLNRIVVNKCKNLFRSRKTVELDEDGIWYKNHVQEDRLYMLPQATMNYKNDQHVIRVLMDRLSDSQRVVLMLRYFNDMSMKEMADLLEVPEGTIKTRLLYGKNHLRKLVHEYEQETNTKLNFQVDALSIAGVFGYMMAHTPTKGLSWMKKTKWNVKDVALKGCAIGIGAAVVVGAISMTDQFFQKDVSSDQGVEETGYSKQAKDHYFILMDWACCKADMLKKSKADFDEIMPIYESMIHSSSRYLERLKKDHWIEDFELIYQQF